MRLGAASLAAALAALAISGAAAEGAEILVSAAASLSDALTEIGGLYGPRDGVAVRFNFGASSELARQIDEGAPADVFFSADAEKMDFLERRGLIDPATRLNLLSNRLVMIVPRDSTLGLRMPADLRRPEVKRIALAQPESVPVGIYAKQFLQSEGLWRGLEPKIVPLLDARATLAAVESGNFDAGFVYKTDAAISRKIKIAHEAPPGKGAKIVYPVAVVRRTKNHGAARGFVDFAAGGEARAVYKKHGFVVLE